MQSIQKFIFKLNLPENRKTYYRNQLEAKGTDPTLLQELMLEYHQWVESELMRLGVIDKDSESYKNEQAKLKIDLDNALEKLKQDLAESDSLLMQAEQEMQQEDDID